MDGTNAGGVNLTKLRLFHIDVDVNCVLFLLQYYSRPLGQIGNKGVDYKGTSTGTYLYYMS